MIESKSTFLQMQVEGSFVDSSESEQAGFRKAPESFNPIHMRSAAHKFILAMIHPEMFAISHIDQAIIPSPPIRIDHTVQGNLATNNGLQCGFSAVRDEFSVDLAIPLENPKDDSFAIGSSSSFPFDAARAKVRLIDLDLPTKRRMHFTELRDACPDSPHIPVHRITIQAGQESHL